ncbi:MAG: hypothetical protein ACOWWH_03395 [Eubacteriaceae bacterium]
MIKRINMAVFILLLSLLLAACNTQKPLSYYQKSVEKTEEIEKGKMSLDITVLNDFKTDNLTKEEILKISSYSKLELNLVSQYDYVQNCLIGYGYFNSNNVGYDFEIYDKDDNIYLKLPMLENYYQVDSDDFEQNEEQEDFVKTITENWTEMLQQEDVVKGEDSILNTEDGQVKIVKYTITPSSEEMKQFITESFIIAVRENYELIKEYVKDIEIDMEQLKIFDDIKNIEYIETAYIDIDGYMVQNDIDINMQFSGEHAPINDIQIKIIMNNWNIEKEQSFDFPNIDSDRIIPVKELDFSNLGGE